MDELLPRDLVSRAIAVKLAAEGSEHVWLDATALEDFGRRFPTIKVALTEVGLDPARDWLPVAPAAHYLSGGVLVDLDGASSLPGLWAAGEVACTGVHGANRLASNSLLEGMVFGARCVDAILSGRDAPEATGALAGLGRARARGGHRALHRGRFRCDRHRVAGADPVPVSTPCRAAPSCRATGTRPPVRATARAALQGAMTSWAGVVATPDRSRRPPLPPRPSRQSSAPRWIEPRPR